MSAGTLHVLYTLRAEGCPRLALGLAEQEILEHSQHCAVAVCSPDTPDLRADFDKLGVPIFELQWRRRGFVGLIRRAYRLLRQLQPRRIICYTLGLHVSIAAAARLLKIPVIVHLGCAPPVTDRNALAKLRLQMRIGDPLVARYACCSEYVRQQSAKVYHLSLKKMVTIPNGIPVRNFAAQSLRAVRPLTAVKRPPIIVGMVGSLETSKDHPTLLRALRRANDRSIAMRLRVIGAGSRETELRALAGELAIADQVEWVGTVTDVAAELARLDVFAYSVLPGEGLGMALIEALVAGIPIVAADVGASREVLEDGRLGRLVAAGDADAWATALLQADRIADLPSAWLERYDIQQTARCYDKLSASNP